MENELASFSSLIHWDYIFEILFYIDFFIHGQIHTSFLSCTYVWRSRSRDFMIVSELVGQFLAAMIAV